VNDQPKAISRTWWSYVRSSLRGLLVLVLVIGAALVWVVRPARIQRDAVAAIERAGGQVAYDWEYFNGMPNRNARPWAPKLLVDLVGVDCFGHVAWIDLRGTRPDAVMPHVGQLDQTENLILWHSSVTDAGLTHLKRLMGVQYLNLGQTGVTDAGLLHLRGLTSLRYLNLSFDQVTDAGLAHLAGLTRLQALDLRDTQVNDDGLTYLNGLTRLNTLILSRTQVTDAGLTDLEGLSSLEVVYLKGTKVTDSGVEELRQALPVTYIAH